MKDKIKKWLVNNKLYIQVFVVTAIIYSLCVGINGIILHKNNILFSDLYAQYAPMLINMRNILFNGDSLAYTFNYGLGTVIAGDFFNYLSSPLNLLFLFFSGNNVEIFIYFIVGLRLAFTSVIAVYFLNKKFNVNNIYLVGLGIMYALSNYFIAYYWNIMWLDGMLFLPLIILGVDKIVAGHNGLFYMIFLWLMIVSNYYIAFMICMFLPIYFMTLLITTTKIKKDNIKSDLKIFGIKIIKFISYSLLATLMASFVLLPVIDAISKAGEIGTEFYLPLKKGYYYNINFLDFISAHFSFVKTNIFASYPVMFPNISVGVFGLFLSVLLFFNKKITVDEKIFYGTLLLFFFFVFQTPAMDFIFHGLHIANQLPFRYSFLYTFVLFLISSYSLIKIEDCNTKFIIGVYSFIVLFLIVSFKLNIYLLSNKVIIGNLIYLSLYLIILILIKYKNNKWGYILFILIVISEVGINFGINNHFNELSYYSTYKEESSNIRDDSEFYRIGVTDKVSSNDGAVYNYHGFNGFSSMMPKNIPLSNKYLGGSGNELNSIEYTQNTPIYNLIYNIKYVEGDIIEDDYFKNINSDLYHFNKNVGLMFGVNKTIKEWINKKDVIVNQNDFIKSAVGIEETLVASKLVNREVVMEDEFISLIAYDYTGEGTFYIDAIDDSVNFVVVDNKRYLYDTWFHKYDKLEMIKDTKTITLEPRYILNGKEDKVKRIYVGYYKNKAKRREIKVYNIDKDKFNDAYSNFINNKVNIMNFEDDFIEGNIKLEEDKAIFTSIPFDNNWDIFVDDKKVDTYQIYDTFMGFDVDKGTHTIKLVYKNIPFIKGIIISLVTFIFVLIYMLIKKLHN